ncbi:MAG: phage portal protein [Clostridiales bacterium]|nr:phage portal protein [Clostridiales bacterium]
MGFLENLQHGWNAFLGRDGPTNGYRYLGEAYYTRPDRVQLTRGHERSIINAVYNRIAMDAATINIRHVRTDEEGRFKEEIDSDLNTRLSLSANRDQTGRAFIQDAVMSMLDEGCIALVPTDTNVSPIVNDAFKIESMRVAKIIQWYPKWIRVEVYDENTGHRVERNYPKNAVAIIENPFYSVMNEPSSTASRLMRKLNLLDTIDEQNSSGKLDMIIQLPYIIKTPARRQQAENRRKDIEMQLSSSKYGIAYTDGTEKITQLNRSIDNNMISQVEFFTNMLYSQLGITQSILDGTADEKVMQNYYTRTIEPIVASITDEMKRKFLTPTARTQGQSIMFFRDPFKLMPIADFAELADKLTRNCIATSNEIRQAIGMKPMDDPQADQLVNNNLSQPKEQLEQAETAEIDQKIVKRSKKTEEIQNG